MPGSEGKQFLDLGTMSTLDRQLRCLMENVDDLSQEANKFNNFQRQNAKQLQDKHKFMQKRVSVLLPLCLPFLCLTFVPSFVLPVPLYFTCPFLCLYYPCALYIPSWL